jgi:hypothetical protein
MSSNEYLRFSIFCKHYVDTQLRQLQRYIEFICSYSISFTDK